MPPLSLGSIPTIAQLYRSTSSPLYKSASQIKDVASAANQEYNDRISVVREDITSLHVDAIVNAANNSLMGGGGVDGAIHRAAGPDLKKECAKLDGCDTGSAKMTKAYELPCRHVIHAVGPVYGSASSKKKGGHTKLLKGCYRTALELAHDASLKSIAFSAISTGVYGYPSGEAADTVLATVREFLDETGADSKRLERIVFCNFTEKDEKAYETHLPKYFPPNEADLKGTSTDSSNNEDGESLDKLTEQLPDVPTEEPEEPDPEGAPARKRVKVASSQDDDQNSTEEKESTDQEEIDKAEDQSTGMTQAVDEVHFDSQDTSEDGRKSHDEEQQKFSNTKITEETVEQPRQGQEQAINPA